AEGRQNSFRPFRKLDLDVQGRAVTCVAPGIAEARVDLMLDVPRRPHAVQVEAAGTDDAFAELLKQGLPVNPVPIHESAQIAVALGILNELELVNDVIGAFFEARVAGGRPSQTHSRKIVPGDVSGELPSIAIPAAVALC